MWAGLLSLLGCDVGGPIERQLPEEQSVLRELRAGDRTVRVLAVTLGAVHKGQSLTVGTQSEAGFSVDWARAGERYAAELRVEVVGGRMSGTKIVDGKLILASQERLPSRAVAQERLRKTELEACAAGDRVALRARFPGSEWGQTFHLIDVTDPQRPRWGIVISDLSCQKVAETLQAFVWHESKEPGAAAKEGK